MSTELITLIDTSIKIGLGALIAAISGYLITKVNHRSELEKEFKARRFNTIESICTDAESYFQSWRSFSSSVGGVSVKRIDKNIQVTTSDWNFINNKDREFVNVRNNNMTAVSKLKILRLNDAAKTLEGCTNIEDEYRQMVLFDKKLPTTGINNNFKERMNTEREFFYNELSDHYV